MYFYFLLCNLSQFLHPVLSLTDIKKIHSISRLKASALSFFFWVRILQAFKHFVCSFLGHLLHMCIFLPEHAQNKAPGLNLALLVLDGVISHLKFLAAVCIHTASDGVCVTPWPGSVDLGSTCTLLYCCLIACPPQLIISAWGYL